MDKVNQLSALEGAEINEAKIILANETTTLPARKRRRRRCKQRSRPFGSGVGEGSQVTIDAGEVESLGMIAALVVGTKSNGEERRLIRGGGARLNDALSLTKIFSLVLMILLTAARISAGRSACAPRHQLSRESRNHPPVSTPLAWPDSVALRRSHDGLNRSRARHD